VRFEQPKQAGAVRQVGKQRPTISFHPPIESAVAYPFEGKQDPQRDDFAAIQVRLAMFGHIRHDIIYTTKQFCDKIYRAHEARSSDSSDESGGLLMVDVH
jgi:hypothetical protein